MDWGIDVATNKLLATLNGVVHPDANVDDLVVVIERSGMGLWLMLLVHGQEMERYIENDPFGREIGEFGHTLLARGFSVIYTQRVFVGIFTFVHDGKGERRYG